MNSVLCDAQHGFRKNHSCVTQLIATITEIASLLDQGVQTDILFFDFSKAFDEVPHARLFIKLDYYGIRGPYLDWIRQILIEVN